MHRNTISIAACDLEENAWGVAVVSWARADEGAVATLALAQVGFGPEGLDLMAHGVSAPEALLTLLAADPGSADRQEGLVNAQGRTAVHTG